MKYCGGLLATPLEALRIVGRDGGGGGGGGGVCVCVCVCVGGGGGGGGGGLSDRQLSVPLQCRRGCPGGFVVTDMLNYLCILKINNNSTGCQ